MASVDPSPSHEPSGVCCPVLHSGNAIYALPLKTLNIQGERCLHSSQLESASDLLHLLAHRISQYTSHCGRIYFKYGSFLTPCNLANRAVLLAFVKAADQIVRCLDIHKVPLATREVVIVLQCISLTQLRFYYYVVDHSRGQIVDTHTHPEGTPGVDYGAYDGPTQSLAEYWDHVGFFHTHRSCTQRAYDDACRLAWELALKSSLRAGMIHPNPGVEMSLHQMLSRFDRDNIDVDATFSTAKTMSRIFEVASRECVAREVSPQPTLAQSLMGLFSGVFGSGNGMFEDEWEEPDPDHPLAHDDSPDSAWI